MSGRHRPAIAKCVLAAAVLTASLCGCTYDYLQNSDRVAYTAGDAVKANLESETINPSKRSMYITSGLGANGPVILDPATTSGSSTAAPATSTTSTTTTPSSH